MPVAEVDEALLSNIWEEVPDSFNNCRITFSGKRPIIKVGTDVYGGYVPTLGDLKSISSSFGTSIEKIDTLADIDKWIPFNDLMRHIPIYRLTGVDGSYTYVSSKTGEILQHNTAVGRRWAWVGALPHYVYITPLRRDSKMWKNTVIWMSGLCTVSVIFGLVIAVRFLIKTRRLKIFGRKSWQWHYSWGLIFGLSMLAFIFSGMMSLAQIPDWLMKSKPAPPSKLMVAKDNVDLSILPEKFGIANIDATPLPSIKITSGETTSLLPLNSDSDIDFSPDHMRDVVARHTGEPVIKTESITDDIFYSSQGVPGYKAVTENYTVYWNDEGYFRVMDSKSKAQAVCYRILHTMNLPLINKSKWIHDVFMWILLTGGLVVVVTGTILSIKSLSRGNAKERAKKVS